MEVLATAGGFLVGSMVQIGKNAGVQTPASERRAASLGQPRLRGESRQNSAISRIGKTAPMVNDRLFVAQVVVAPEEQSFAPVLTGPDSLGAALRRSIAAFHRGRRGGGVPDRERVDSG